MLDGPTAANAYTFSAGNAALAQPLAGANIVKRTKLQIFTPVTGYTRTTSTGVAPAARPWPYRRRT